MPYYANRAMRGLRRPPEIPGRQWILYDSVVANYVGGSGQVHREFVIYDRLQAYPEYLVKVVAS